MDNEYISLEALSRLYHPELGWIAPDLFIELAEKNHTITKITDLQFHRVCKFVKENEVVQLPMQEGVNHYDYYKDHFHFECLNCGKIIDIFDDELLKKLVNRFQNRDEEINIYNLMLEGYCSSCKKKKEKEGK